MVLALIHKAVVLSKEPQLAALQLLLPRRVTNSPAQGPGADPALPAPGLHASSSLAIQILPLARSLLAFPVSEISSS